MQFPMADDLFETQATQDLSEMDDHIEAEVTYLILVELIKEAWDEEKLLQKGSAKLSPQGVGLLLG